MADKTPGRIAYEAWCNAYYAAIGNPAGPGGWERLTSQTRAAWEAAARAAAGACAGSDA